MKEKYLEPKIENIYYVLNDVIVTSGETSNVPDPNEGEQFLIP